MCLFLKASRNSVNQMLLSQTVSFVSTVYVYKSGGTGWKVSGIPFVIPVIRAAPQRGMRRIWHWGEPSRPSVTLEGGKEVTGVQLLFQKKWKKWSGWGVWLWLSCASHFQTQDAYVCVCFWNAETCTKSSNQEETLPSSSSISSSNGHIHNNNTNSTQALRRIFVIIIIIISNFIIICLHYEFPQPAPSFLCHEEGANDDQTGSVECIRVFTASLRTR